MLCDLAEKEEGVFSYALFPQVAKKFFEQRRAEENAEKTVSVASEAAPAVPLSNESPKAASNEVRTIYVEDLTEGMPL